MSYQRVKFYQTGTFTVGNRLLDEVDRTVQARTDRTNSLNSGHRACQGCGEALGARYALDAVMRATQNQLVAVNATGCLEVFSSPYPESAWQIPWLHSVFGNAPAVASGVAAALRAKGKTDIRVVAQGGDGATVDIGFGCLSGMFERNDDVLYLCYDNEAYMNTGVQRSGATPARAWTNTTQAVGTEPGNPMDVGKNLPRIAMAHGIPYVATASVADLHDLEAKVSKKRWPYVVPGISIFTYPVRSGGNPIRPTTIKVARLAVESGLFPLFEAEWGVVTDRTPMRKQVPVEQYLAIQGRFKHLYSIRVMSRHWRPFKRWQIEIFTCMTYCQLSQRWSCDMERKPFAITLDPASSLANHTGNWRTMRPIYVDHLPPCNQGCPAGENIQGWLYEAEEGKYEEAWRKIMEDNPFPAIHGRVCYHPCETACNRSQLDEAVSIHAVERFLGDYAIEQGWQIEAGVATGKQVLIIGAGPSGLVGGLPFVSDGSCRHDL